MVIVTIIILRYIYRLADLHKANGNFVEASFTLLLHAELLQWTNQMQKQEGQYQRQTSSERKEALYSDIIDYFDKGKVRVHVCGYACIWVCVWEWVCVCLGMCLCVCDVMMLIELVFTRAFIVIRLVVIVIIVIRLVVFQ